MPAASSMPTARSPTPPSPKAGGSPSTSRPRSLRIRGGSAFMGGQLRNGPDNLVEPADVIEQRGNGNQVAAEHQAGLNHVRPDDGLDPAGRGIESADDGPD